MEVVERLMKVVGRIDAVQTARSIMLLLQTEDGDSEVYELSPTQVRALAAQLARMTTQLPAGCET